MNTIGTARQRKGENTQLIREIVESGVSFLLGIIVCRGVIFSSLAPFGVSYTAACRRNRLIWALLGSSLGYIILNPSQPFRYIAVCIAVGVIRWTLEDVKLLSRSMLYAPTIAFLPIFASGIAMIFVKTSTLGDFSTVLTEALLSAGAAFFMKKSIAVISEERRLYGLSQSDTASLALTGCILMLSLGSVEVENVSLGRILSVMTILLCARYGSAAGGAVAGAATGSVFGMSSSGYAYICAGYSFGGLIGGLFSLSGKLGVTVSFLICNGIMLLSSGETREALPLFIETVIGAAAFMLLPRELERYVTPLFMPRDSSRGERSLRDSLVMRLDFASNALKNVSGSVNNVSRRLSRLYAPNATSIYENVRGEVCSTCGLKTYCWERQQKVTEEDFSRLAAPLRAQGFVTEADVESLFSKKCCRPLEIADSLTRGYRDYLGGLEAARRVGEIRSVTAGQFSGLSEILSDLAGELERYKSFDPDCSARVLEHLRSIGLEPNDCGCMLDQNGRMSVEIRLENGSKTAIKRNALAKELSGLCGRCFDTPVITEIGSRRRITLSEIPLFDAEVGVYQHICGGGKLCGDCVGCFSNGFGEFVALISDGMGTGGRAAVDSNMTVSILKRLLKSGLSDDTALKVVNSALMVKSEDESLSTVDLLKVDLFSGRAVIGKAGAPATFVRKGGRVVIKNAPSLPVGILGEVSFSKQSVKLSEGDVVVMVSDGAFTGEERWLENLIKSYEDGTCQDLAKKVVEEAIKRRNDGHDDDVTAVVLKLHNDK